MSRKNQVICCVLGAALLAGSAGCRNEGAAGEGKIVITLGAYTTPREAYGTAVLPAFREAWKKDRGQEVEFSESYLGSGAQARAIVGGFEADVAALSLEADVRVIQDAGLITHDWKAGPTEGMVSRSLVVLGVREGNPKGIRDWADLARPGLEVLTPNVRTSGGAMWNIMAIWGACLRGHAGLPAGDREAAVDLMGRILANVRIMDKGARDSMLTFERGVGDVIITYENEILVARDQGQKYDYVIPTSTILIENPVSLIDVNVERHGNRAATEAFVRFLFTEEAQRHFARYGLRPVLDSVAAEVADRYPPVTDLFTVRDLGGWDGVQTTLFDKGAAYDQAMARGRPE
ncbi:MAG: sulfate ABC transporter substrate-binding protein [Deltaproteobacteria bacterium]|nr:sulfate ABC transporter substrate-binding protein [Deltaproteobacteria bacterium]